jgi:hypothetical protein
MIRKSKRATLTRVIKPQKAGPMPKITTRKVQKPRV